MGRAHPSLSHVTPPLTYSFDPASEPKLTNHAGVQDGIQGHKVGKAPIPNGIPYIITTKKPVNNFAI
jgi:hypothetical protein